MNYSTVLLHTMPGIGSRIEDCCSESHLRNYLTLILYTLRVAFEVN